MTVWNDAFSHVTGIVSLQTNSLTNVYNSFFLINPLKGYTERKLLK